MKILILGAKGFIGSSLMAYLKDYDVTGLTMDIRNKEALRTFFIDKDFVIHAAGEVKKLTDEEACHSTNVLGTKNVIELCREYGCKLIHLSSTARKMAYGRSKQESQKMVEDAVDLKRVILRLCPIVRLDDPLMKWGRRYALEYLMRDIDDIIKNHDFNKFELIDYQKFKGPR